jgi:tetratricopeptide (TPR) repeat protein
MIHLAHQNVPFKQVTAMTRIACSLLLLTAITLLSGCMGNKAAVPLTKKQSTIGDLNERALNSAGKGYDHDALKLLQEAFRLAATVDDLDGQIITLLNQSRLARHNAQPQLAEKSADQALSLAKGTVHFADAAQEKSLQELSAHRLDEAGHWAETAHTAEQGKLLGRRLNLLARIALLKGDRAEATHQAELALAANRGDELVMERANSLRVLGIIKTQEGQHAEAEQLLQEALRLDKQQAASAKIAADLEALAELAGLKGEQSRQQDYLQRAKAVRHNSRLSKK